jgi:beta-lactamase regulating signal transducer with metallopeptidase domain
MSYAFFLEMGWKSAAIAGAALLLMILLRRRSAADRGAVLRLGVGMLLLLPLVAVAMPALVVETAPPAPVAAASDSAVLDAAAAYLAEAELNSPETMASSAAAQAAGDWNDPGILFALLYAGGLIMVGGRLAAGLWTLRRWTAEAREVSSPEWRGALERAHAGRDVRLLVSDEAASPMSWGWRRPVILIDRDALGRTEDAEAIVAHEVAHIVRGDWPTLILSRLTVALFWFNPLVWWLDREVAQQAEEAADSHAAERVEPARYAQTLLDWARQSGTVMLPANSMAGSEPGLVRRVKAVLDGRSARRSGSFWTVAAMLSCAAFAVPVAALEFIPRAPEPPAPPAPLAAPPVPPAPFALAPPAPLAPLAPLAARLQAPGTPPAPPALPAHAAPPAPPAPPIQVRIAAISAATMAAAQAARHGEHVDAEALQRDIEQAIEEATREAEIAGRVAHQAAAAAARAAKEGMARGADGMMKGADEMERGAERMRVEARKLRSSREYREEQIARAARRGDRLTHEQLIEAAGDMEKGAVEMREGAAEMRESAREMRRGG